MDLPHDTETIDDLSALAWVQDELRRSLEAAHKAMRRYLKEAEALAGSDIDADVSNGSDIAILLLPDTLTMAPRGYAIAHAVWLSRALATCEMKAATWFQAAS